MAMGVDQAVNHGVDVGTPDAADLSITVDTPSPDKGSCRTEVKNRP